MDQSLKRIGGGFHQQAVDLFWMGTGQRTQFGRQRKGHVEIGTGQKAVTLSSEPALRLIVVTLRAGAIFAGVIGKDLLPTVIALVDMASKERRTASGNIPERPFPIRVQSISVLLAIRGAVEADDIGHLQHEDPL